MMDFIAKQHLPPELSKKIVDARRDIINIETTPLKQIFPLPVTALLCLLNNSEPQDKR
jgi:hypothetical protein